MFLINVEKWRKLGRPSPNFEKAKISIISTASEIVFFDISEFALEWQKRLWEHWDEKNYPEFIQQRKTSSYGSGFIEEPTDESIGAERLYENRWQLFLEEFGGEANWLSCWHAYRNSQPQFIVCDLLSWNRKYLLSLINPKRQVIFAWSNILTTSPCLVHWTRNELTLNIEDFLAQLAKACSNARILGPDPNWNFLDLLSVESVIEKIRIPDSKEV